MAVDPSEFDFWLEYLQLQPDMELWEETFDLARQNWQLNVCWRLLREGRRQAHTPVQQAYLRFYEGLFHMHSGDWDRAGVCFERAFAGVPPEDVSTHFSLLGELGMLARLRGEGRRALDLHQQQLDVTLLEEAPAWQAEAWDRLGMDYELLNTKRNLPERIVRAVRYAYHRQRLWCRAEGN